MLNDGAKTEVPSSTLCADAATWLLWAMSWRGISSPRQLFAEALHPPTLLINWWSKMPAPLRFGPTRSLLRALCAVMEQTYSLLVEGRFANARASNLSIGSTLGNDLLRYHDPKSHQ